MTTNQFNEKLFRFITKSSSPFHAVAYIEKQLTANGFIKLDEGVRWALTQGGRYFVIRNGAIAAFSFGKKTDLDSGFRIIGAHTDSPSFQIKPNHRKNTEPYLLLGVEKYGGPILSSWFDRELSLAGRVVIDTGENCLKSVLVDLEEPLLYIPSVAIHLNREVNEGQAINVQKNVSPVIGQYLNNHLPDLTDIIYDQTATQYPDHKFFSVKAFELFCYDISKPSFFGLNKEFISAPRLDNLLSCFVGLASILRSDDNSNTFLICNNHEEIGSMSESGAQGSFLQDIMSRFFENNQDMLINRNNSLFLSLDNAHAYHPNYRDTSDPDHPVLLNKGPVIKLNANQRYSTTAFTSAFIKKLADDAGIRCQYFVMRSDLPCGSTIGPITSAHLGIKSVDVGAPTWAMHSVREVTGCEDPINLFKLASLFFNKKNLI